MLEILFLLLLACVIATFLWYRSFQEFTILQLEYAPLLVIPDERVPIIIRGIPMQFKTSWLSVLAKQSSLPVLLEDNTRTLLKEYAVDPKGLYHRLTGTELAAKFHIHSKFKDTMMFLAKFWYLPVAPLLSPASLWILNSHHSGIGLQRSLAERTVLTVHEGKVTVWLSRHTHHNHSIAVFITQTHTCRARGLMSVLTDRPRPRRTAMYPCMTLQCCTKPQRLENK